MAIKTQGEAAKAAKEAVITYDKQIKELQQEIDETFRAILKFGDERTEIINNLIGLVFTAIEDLPIAMQVFKAPHLKQTKDNLEKDFKKAKNDLQNWENDANTKNLYALIAPQIGTLITRLEEVNELETTYFQEKNKYNNNRSFLNYNKIRATAGKISFWDRIFFRADKIEKTNQIILSLFNLTNLEECYARFDFVEKMFDELKAEKNNLNKQKNKAEKKWQEYSLLKFHVENFDAGLIATLKDKIKTHLLNIDFDVFLKKSSEEHQIYFTQCHVLQKKIMYLEDIKKYLQKEILDRRNNREKMVKLANIWAKSTHIKMPNDKTNWLIHQPASKQVSTSKNIGYIRNNREIVVNFDDYAYYHNAYNQSYQNKQSFLAFDLFVYHADSRPAYDGFNQKIFEEVREYRVEHGGEKPDYSFYKSLDKEIENNKQEENLKEEVYDAAENEAIEALIEDNDAEIEDIS